MECAIIYNIWVLIKTSHVENLAKKIILMYVKNMFRSGYYESYLIMTAIFYLGRASKINYV